MSLASNVTARYGGSGSSFLIGLTNPFAPSATSIDSTQLGNACTDVQADFEIYAGAAYDDTNALHVTTAVQCVIAKLKLYTGQFANAEAEVERCKASLVALSKVGARNRFLVKSTSGVTESDENPNGDTIRPEFDSDRFRGYVPDNQPRDSTEPQVGA